MEKAFFELDPIEVSDQYKAAFKDLTARVRWEVMQRDPAKSLFNLHDAIIGNRHAERKDLLPLFAADADKLLLQARRGRGIVEPNSVLSSPEAPDKLLERFTGTWLAMYFLGCPVMQAWEAVAFFAEGSGFPRGASLCKAVGDVYRSARKSNLARFQRFASQAEPKPVYVLDHNPLAMQKVMDAMDEWEKRERDGQTPSDKSALYTYIACLGMLYERLQLALYLHSGGPMHFFVPRTSLERAFAGYHSKAEPDPRKFMWSELKFCFTEQFQSTQFVRIVDEEELIYLPGCVLSGTQGIYRPREMPRTANPGRAGNYLPSRVRREFEEKMIRAANKRAPGAPGEEKSLQQVSEDDFRNRCPA